MVHKLRCQKPRTTHELLEIATSHVSSEEAGGDVFERDQHTAKKATWPRQAFLEPRGQEEQEELSTSRYRRGRGSGTPR